MILIITCPMMIYNVRPKCNSEHVSSEDNIKSVHMTIDVQRLVIYNHSAIYFGISHPLSDRITQYHLLG